MSKDVTFTYKKNGKVVVQVLKWVDKLNSREALGLWHIGSQAWKVYATTKQLTALSKDYARAAIDAGLPMGSPSFQQGDVKQGDGRASPGFVLITAWMDGTNFQKTVASFNAALTREKFPHDKNSTDYKRLLAGTVAADKVGLTDCQGFIKPGIFEPLRFIDVHTSWNETTKKYGHSGFAAELHAAAIAWAK